jgi:preprotein translocase subunit SecG
MLQTSLLVVLILDSFVLVAGILLQSGKGTGMAASFGGVSSSPDAFIGTRQAGNLLTKISWWSGGLFLGIAFVLQIASAHTRVPKSVLDQSVTPAPASAVPTPSTTAPALPFQNAPPAATPVNPATPAPSSAPSRSRAAPTGSATPRSAAPGATAPTGTAPAPSAPPPASK